MAFAPIGDVSIFEADGTTVAAIVKNSDYTLDAFGNFTVISNTISENTQFKLTYKKLNPSAITAGLLIGGVDENDIRSGLSLFDLAFNMFGFNPKIFVSPGYSSLSAIVAAFATAAEKFRAVYLVDAPYGTTIAGAIAGRGLTEALYSTPAMSVPSCCIRMARHTTITAIPIPTTRHQPSLRGSLPEQTIISDTGTHLPTRK